MSDDTRVKLHSPDTIASAFYDSEKGKASSIVCKEIHMKKKNEEKCHIQAAENVSLGRISMLL